jgi:hypothetical protein
MEPVMEPSGSEGFVGGSCAPAVPIGHALVRRREEQPIEAIP